MQIHWNEALSVGVTEIDQQHQHLIKVINELDRAMKQGKGKDALRDVINHLIKYTNEHFKTEENYLAQAAYEDLPAHKQEHAAFIGKIRSFRDGYLSGQLCLSIEIMNFLSDWIVSHIKQSDLKYAPCLAGK